MANIDLLAIFFIVFTVPRKTITRIAKALKMPSLDLSTSTGHCSNNVPGNVLTSYKRKRNILIDSDDDDDSSIIIAKKAKDAFLQPSTLQTKVGR